MIPSLPAALSALVLCTVLAPSVHAAPPTPLPQAAAPKAAAPKAQKAEKVASAEDTAAYTRVLGATPLLLSLQGAKETFAPAVLVSSDGLVLTTHKVVDGAEEVLIYLPPQDRVDERFPPEELIKYPRAQLERALRAKVLLIDPKFDLAFLTLPLREDPYPAVSMAENLRQGEQVAVFSAPGSSGGFAHSLGVLGVPKKDQVQVDLKLAVAPSGPMYTSGGQLAGYVVSGKNKTAFARPVSALRAMFGVAEEKRRQFAAQNPLPQPPKGGPSIDTLMHSLGEAWLKKLGRFQATRLYCEFLAAKAQFGRSAIYGGGEVEAINTAMNQLLKSNQVGTERLLRDFAQYLPALIVANDGHLWHKEQKRYALDFPALAWDVDDQRGIAYATNTNRELLFVDKGTDGVARFRPTGLSKIRDFQVSGGDIYYVTMDGALMMRQGPLSKNAPVRLLLRNVKPDQVVASQGILYLVEGGQLYRRGKGQWDRGGEPIQRNVRSVVVNGPSYYAIDTTGHLYSGLEARVIDPENTFSGVWLIGRNILALTRKGTVRGYDARTGKWQMLRE